jgi:hypothetical protein
MQQTIRLTVAGGPPPDPTVGHVAPLFASDPRALRPGTAHLDRFHIVSQMNKAPDYVRASEARRLAAEGRLHALGKLPEPKLAHEFW